MLIFAYDFLSTELGPIPEHFQIKQLGEVTDNFDNERVPLSKRNREEGEYPYYGANGVNDYVNDYLFDGEYILVGEDGTVKDENGHPIVNYINEKFWVSNHAHILQGSSIPNSYLNLALKNINIEPYITGSVQEKVSQTNLNSIEIAVPPEDSLNKFNDIVKPMFKEMWALEAENQDLEKLRDYTLPILLSGN